MAKEKAIQFVRWLDPEKKIAVVKLYGGGEYYVPRTRLIPHLFCEMKYSYLKDPNLIAIKCAEESSVFGIPVFRHIFHLTKIGNPKAIEPEKIYDFPKDIDFSCVRDKILEGVDTDKAIQICRRRKLL